MDITQLILDDHHQQRAFAILEEVDRADTRTLETLWARLLGAPGGARRRGGEKIFYPELLRSGMSTGGREAPRRKRWTRSMTTTTSGTPSQRSPDTSPAAADGPRLSPR